MRTRESTWRSIFYDDCVLFHPPGMKRGRESKPNNLRLTFNGGNFGSRCYSTFSAKGRWRTGLSGIGAARFLDVGRGIALTGVAFCKKRIDFITIDRLHQVILESGHSGFFNIGRIRVGRHGYA